MIEAEFGQPRDLSAMIGVLSRGGGDPAYRRGADGQIWLTGTERALFDGIGTATWLAVENGILREE